MRYHELKLKLTYSSLSEKLSPMSPASLKLLDLCISRVKRPRLKDSLPADAIAMSKAVASTRPLKAQHSFCFRFSSFKSPSRERKGQLLKRSSAKCTRPSAFVW